MSRVSHRLVRTAIVDRIKQLGLTPNVYEYERFADRIEDLKALYAYEGSIKGGFIQRVSGSEDERGTCAPYLDRWQLSLYQSWSDGSASALTFDDWIDSIINAFERGEPLDSSETFDLSANGQAGGVVLLDSQPIKFAGVLCHSATLQLTTLRYNPTMGQL